MHQISEPRNLQSARLVTDTESSERVIDTSGIPVLRCAVALSTHFWFISPLLVRELANIVVAIGLALE